MLEIKIHQPVRCRNSYCPRRGITRWISGMGARFMLDCLVNSQSERALRMWDPHQPHKTGNFKPQLSMVQYVQVNNQCNKLRIISSHSFDCVQWVMRSERTMRFSYPRMYSSHAYSYLGTFSAMADAGCRFRSRDAGSGRFVDLRSDELYPTSVNLDGFHLLSVRYLLSIRFQNWEEAIFISHERRKDCTGGRRFGFCRRCLDGECSYKSLKCFRPTLVPAFIPWFFSRHVHAKCTRRNTGIAKVRLVFQSVCIPRN